MYMYTYMFHKSRAPTGASISVFDPKQQERVRALVPAHGGFITQICRVRQTETRILWSYSLSDKTVGLGLRV